MLKKVVFVCPWVIIINGLMAIAPYSQASELIKFDSSQEAIKSNVQSEDITVDELPEIFLSDSFNSFLREDYNHSSVSEFEKKQINADTDVFRIITNEGETELISQNASDLEIEQTNLSNSWHFLIQPSIYIPFTIYGDASAGSLTGDFALDASQIRNRIKDDLNFAFFGRMKAWTPDYRLGLFADFDYLSLDSRTSVNRSLPPSLGSIPVTLNAGVGSTLWSLSVGGAYRFYNSSQVNPEGVNTEFDLGSSVFDVFGGLNLTGIDLGLDFNAPGLGSARFDGSKTILSPIVGGRFRYNFNPQWAIVAGGSYSGFGINGLRQWNLSTGVDWLFSEKTSLGLGYRFGYTGYNSTLRTNTDFGIDVNQNGPYLNLSFRF